MRKFFALALVALLAGVGVIAVIEKDPGYILLAYGNYTVETSLWVGLLLLLFFTLAVYLVVRLLRRLLASQGSLAGWIGSRRARASSRLTTRGLISFTEGNWERARRQLLRAARHSEAPLLNYLIAARASDRLGEGDKVREYLVAAEEAESEAGIAVELTQAELQLRSGQYEQALATLVRARRNAGRHPHVLDLLHKAYHALKDWEALGQLLPDLKKYKVLSGDALEALEREVCIHLLEASVGPDADPSGEALRLAWQRVPAHLKQDSAVLHDYIVLLTDNGFHPAAEKVVLRVLKQQWDPFMVRQYAYIQSDDGARQLSRAEGWLTTHPEDAGLLLCLGRLAARERLWGKARDYFEGSYRRERTPEVCAELGRLLLALGEPRVAGAYYREGLQLREADLPDLPMPESVTPVARRLAQSSRTSR